MRAQTVADAVAAQQEAGMTADTAPRLASTRLNVLQAAF